MSKKAVANRPVASRARAAAATRAAEESAADGFQEYPKTMYRKAKVSLKTPNGYEARRVANAEAEAAIGKGWQDSIDQAWVPEVPFGHED